MRVVLVSDFYPPDPGGLEAHVRRLARELRRCGDEVTVVAGGDHPSTVDDGVPVRRVAGSLSRVPFVFRGRAFHPPWPDPVFGAALAAVLDELRPDVVHAHGWCEFSAAAVAGDRPVVVTLHDYGLRCPKKNLLRGADECARGRGPRCLTCAGPEQGAVKRVLLGGALGVGVPRLAGRVARFVAVSEHVARRHREDRGIEVQVIPNFLDPAAEEWTPPGEGLLFVGPADRHKGLPVLLDALRRMPPELARLHVVGVSGPPRPSVVGSHAAGSSVVGARGSAAPAAGPPEVGDPDGPEVDFAGRLTGEPLRAAYRDAAVVVAPPIWPDPCPTVVLEALAAGRPVLGTRVGGLPDLVIDGTTGTLVPAGDPGALAAAATVLLTDRTRLETMSRAAHARAADFATSTVVARIRSVYADACHPVEAR